MPTAIPLSIIKVLEYTVKQAKHALLYCLGICVCYLVMTCTLYLLYTVNDLHRYPTVWFIRWMKIVLLVNFFIMIMLHRKYSLNYSQQAIDHVTLTLSQTCKGMIYNIVWQDLKVSQSLRISRHLWNFSLAKFFSKDDNSVTLMEASQNSFVNMITPYLRLHIQKYLVKSHLKRSWNLTTWLIKSTDLQLSQLFYNCPMKLSYYMAFTKYIQLMPKINALPLA